MKMIPIMSLIGLLLPVLLAQSAFADVAADLRQAEGSYKTHEYSQAERAYLKVIREADPNKPAESEAAFTAGKSLPLVYIAMDRLPQAKDAVQQLLGKYARHEFLPHAVHEIVEGAKPLYKLSHVRQLYGDMVAAKPGDSQALWLKMGVAIAGVHQTDDPATDAALQNIISQHGTDDRVVEALNHIAWACRNLKQYDKALRIYQHVLDNWPGKDRVAFSQHGIVFCQLGLGNRPAADEALNVLLQKYGKDSNASKLFLWAASGYSDAGEVEGAYRVFELVVQNYPDTQEAIQAQAALAIISAQAEDRIRIEPTIQALLTRFAPSDAKAIGLHNVANTLVWKYFAYVDRSAKDPNLLASVDRSLLAVANYTLATWPKSDWSMWAQRDVAIIAIQRGDDHAAEAAISQLTTDFADRQGTPEALDLLAGYCLELGRQNQAEAVYQHLVKAYPTHDLTPLVKVGLGLVQVRRGDDKAADALFQQVLTGYTSHPKLAEVINLVGMGYYQLARVAQSREQSTHVDYYAKASTVWETLARDMPDSPLAPQACYRAAVCLAQELKEYEKGIQCFTLVAESWPHYEYAWHAQAFIASYTDKLKQSGRLSAAEADPVIEHAYEAIVERYPNSSAAPTAVQKLARMKFAKSEWLGAAKYLEMLRQIGSRDMTQQRLLGLLYDLGYAYEQAGQGQAAVQVYREFLRSADGTDGRSEIVRKRAEMLEGGGTSPIERPRS